MNIVALEWLTFGLPELTDAAVERGHTLHLLTHDRGRYAYEFGLLGDRPVVVHDVDTDDPGAVVSAVRGIGDVAGLVGSTDSHCLVALEVCARLGLPGQNPAAVRMVRDKAAMRDRLYERGLSRAAAVRVDAAADADALAASLPLPAVIKDTAGTGSKNVWLARNEAELREVLGRARHARLRGSLSAEPYLVGPLYSVETLTWRGETRVLGVTGRIVSPEPRFREEAVNSPVLLPAKLAEQLDDWIDHVLEAVDYDTGFAHTEFIITREGFEVVEINPRLIGGPVGKGMCVSFDENIYTGFVDMALGRRPELADADLTARCGTAHLLVYAPHPGRYQGIDGLETLALHPGEPVLRHARFPGDTIPTVDDQDGMVAFLSCVGETSELALQNVLSAATKLRVLVERADD